MKLSLFGVVILGLAAFAAGIQDVSDLFTVVLNDNDEGGCEYTGKPFLQNLLQDSYDLGQVGIRLMVDYGNDVKAARRLVDSFFKVTNPPLTADQQKTISTRYQTVSDWIANGGKYNGNTRAGKPFLFCYHSWLLKTSMAEQAYDTTANPIFDSITDQPVMMNQVEKYLQAKAEEEMEYLDKKKQAIPYWSFMHYDYVFDQSYGSAPKGFCSLSGSRAATQHTLNPSTVTLCPRSFGAAGNSEADLTTIRYVARRTAVATPVSRTSVVKTSQQLSALVPTAGTLFHELFHLTLGNDVTYPIIREIYALFTTRTGRGIVGLDYEYAVQNPESFMFAAVAYDYTTNSGTPSIDFSTGFTTRDADEEGTGI